MCFGMKSNRYHTLKHTIYVKESSQSNSLKLLVKVPRYDLYYSLTYFLKWKPFELKTCTGPHYLVLNFY
jgi:hypothetical protein